MIEPGGPDGLRQAIEDRLRAFGLPAQGDLRMTREVASAAVAGIEHAWNLVVPRRLLDEVASRTSLADALADRIRRHLRLRAARQPLAFRGRLRVRLHPPERCSARVVAMSGVMGAYDLEQLVEQAMQMGSGARIELWALDGEHPALGAFASRVEMRTRGAVAVDVRTETVFS